MGVFETFLHHSKSLVQVHDSEMQLCNLDTDAYK